MKKGNTLVIALMAFAIVAFLFVVTYAVTPGLKYPWSTNQAKTATSTVVTSNTTTNVNSVVNTNTTADVNAETNSNTNTSSTADWKTYTNSAQGFTFQYPDKYQVITMTSLDARPKNTIGSKDTIVTGSMVNALLSLTTEPLTKDAYPSLTVHVYSLDRYSYIDRPGGAIYIYKSSTHSFDVGEGDAVVRDAKLETAEGINSSGFITGMGDMGGITKSIIFINEQTQRVVELNFGSGVALDGEEQWSTKNTEIWKDVVKTFSFVASTTADWKTYINTTEHYAIQHPSNWTPKEVAGLNEVQFTKTGSTSIVQPSIRVRAGVSLDDIKKELTDNLSTIGNSLTRNIGGITASGFSYTGAIGADYDLYMFSRNSKSFVFFSAKDDSEWQRALGTFTLITDTDVDG